MDDETNNSDGGTPAAWNAQQAARAMEAGATGQIHEGPTAAGRSTRIRMNTPNIAAGAILCLGVTILWSLSAIPRHADGTTASIPGAGTVSVRTDRALPEHRTMSSTIQSNDRTTRSASLAATTAGLASMAVAGAVAASAVADTTGHRFADFHDARATIDVGGAAVYDPQAGYTAECRIWIDSAPITNDARFPASIMFQHQSGVDHKWLAVESGKATGFAVDSTGASWWNRQWLTSNDNIPLGRWVHLAHVIGTDGRERIYVDGQLNGTQAGSALRKNGANIHLGAALMADFSQVLDSFGGKLDWIRISSVERYGGNSFAVPAEDELLSDAQTDLLVTFNGNADDDAFIDLSPHHYTLTAGAGVSGGTIPPIVPDCNDNGIDDRTELSQGLLADSNGDGAPDGCQCGSIPGLPACCAGDVFSDGLVNGADLGALLSYWGPVTSAPASALCDLDRDGIVGGGDLGILLANWGPCGG